MRIALNIGLFYAAWTVAALAAAGGQSVVAVGVCLIVAAVHIALTASSERRAQGQLLAISAAVGLVVETVLVGLGVTVLGVTVSDPTSGGAGPALQAGVAAPPVWLVSLWLAFGTLLSVSLAGFQRRLALGAVLAAVGGPLSYYAGSRLGAIGLGEPLSWSLGVLAIVWAAVFPMLLIAARRLSPPSP